MEENTSCFHEALYAAGTKYITHIPDKPNYRWGAARFQGAGHWTGVSYTYSASTRGGETLPVSTRIAKSSLVSIIS